MPERWQRRRFMASALGLAVLVSPTLRAEEDHTGGDPLGSMQWPGLRQEFIGKDAMVFSDRVHVKGPAFADDAMNVPLLIDARALGQDGGGIRRVVVVADRNPVRQVLVFEPLRSLPVIAVRIRLEQASPVRAMVQTRDGHWHVGSTWVEAAGGGCTVPGATRADGSWSQTLNQVQARFFNNVLEGSRRLRLRVMHPMDTGLVAGIPAFHLEELELQDATGKPWWRLGLHEPVSENPLITFELPPDALGHLRLVGRDNNGNRIDVELVS
ncbi:MAG: quinoprotein dehydrogenase-associated SoxYZ-like carrier [Burkholderiaceae bacterium]